MTRPLARRALALGAIAAATAAGACSKDADLKLTAAPAAAPFMAHYVALGNSITAGYQSGGINDSTQARSYAVLLAKAAGTTFNVPYLNKPGCTAPIVDLLSGARVGGASASACAGRTTASITATLNNVAVPGANSYDPIGQIGGGSSVLTTLFLGGRTQVERALETDPTFATVWIGNNDVLSFALSGTTAGVTDSLTFITNYNSMIAQLRSRNAALKGVLIGVVDVTNVPLLVPISLINPASATQTPAAAYPYSPSANGLVTQIIGHPLQFAANCTNSSQASIAFNAFATIAATLRQNNVPAAVPFTFVCAGTSQTGGMLDSTERAFFVNRVGGWNAYIKAKADSIGFAYYDPNVALLSLRAAGAIVPFPNVQSATPFGPYISNDGVHPGTAAHVRIANEIAALVNTKYGSTIPTNIAAP